MKKLLISLLAFACIVYAVRSWTMTEAEEQPFLDAKASEDLSFLTRIKQFFTNNNNQEAKIDPAAGAEAVAEGARPKRRSIRSAVAQENEPAEEDMSLPEEMPSESHAMPLDAEMVDEAQEKEMLPEEEEMFAEPTAEQVLPEASEQMEMGAESEESNAAAPEETFIEQAEGVVEPKVAPQAEPEINELEQESIEFMPESEVQKEVDQIKRESVEGIE